MKNALLPILNFTCAFLLVGIAPAQEPMPSNESLEEAFPNQQSYSPYAGRNFPTRV
jgi:hypothetical protein